MPKAVPVTFADFRRLETGAAEVMRCKEVSGQEMDRIRRLFGFAPAHNGADDEAGYKRSVNGFTLWIWTSCLREEIEWCRREPLVSDGRIVSRPSGGGAGRVYITDARGRALYFAHHVARTEGFILNLLRVAWLALWRICHPQWCPECSRIMRIIQHKDDGGTFWACLRTSIHRDGEPRWADWDKDLPPKAMATVLRRRGKFRSYLKTERSQGNEPERAWAFRTGPGFGKAAWEGTVRDYLR